MARKFLISIFASVLFLGLPVQADAATAVEIIETDFQPVVISVDNSTLRVSGANGQMLYVYNVAGVRVMSIKVDGADRRYDLNLPKGCYIVKVGKVVRKISVK